MLDQVAVKKEVSNNS
jgi:hypothetical protein